jgi:hypothetical protein
MTLAASMESSPPEISATAFRGVPVAGAVRAGAIEVAGSGCWGEECAETEALLAALAGPVV